MTQAPQMPTPLDPDQPLRKKSVAYAALVFGGALLLPFIGVMLLWSGRCPTQPVQRVLSPDGTMLAEQVSKNCGERMPEATEVRLARLDQGRERDSSTVLILPTTDKLIITWNSDRNLAITLPNNQSQVVKFRDHWQQVQVSLIGDVISSVPKELEHL